MIFISYLPVMGQTRFYCFQKGVFIFICCIETYILGLRLYIDSRYYLFIFLWAGSNDGNGH
jgi:hypothetical protein